MKPKRQAQPQQVNRDGMARRREMIRQAYRAKFEGKDGKKYKRSVEEKLVRDLTQRRDLEYHHRLQQREDEKFFEGGMTQWDSLARKNPAMRDLTINIIRKPINFMAGIVKARKTVGYVRAQGISGYRDIADDQKRHMMKQVIEEYSRRLSIIQERTDWRFRRDARIDSACRSGIGYLHHYPEISPETGELIIRCDEPDWQNVYSDSNTKDMRNREFCFVLSTEDATRVKARFNDPEASKWIEDHCEEVSVSRVVDQSFADYQGYGNLFNGDYGTSSNRSTGNGRKQIVSGVVYYRDTVYINAVATDIMVCARIVLTSSMERLHIVGTPTILPFARPPIVDLPYTVFRDTRLPYSSLVRDRRGIARTMNALMRNAIHLMTSRGMIVNVRGYPAEVDIDKELRGLARRISQPTYVVAEYGVEGSLRIENHAADADKLIRSLQQLGAMAHDTSEVQQALMKGEAESATMFQMLKNDAGIAITEFQSRADQAVKEDAEILLSYIEQFNGYINYGWGDDHGQLIEMTADGDATIEGNKAFYQIEEANRDHGIYKMHQETLQALISKADYFQGLPLYAKLVETLQMPGGEAMVQDIKYQMQKAGVPVPPSLLTDQERQQQEQAQAQQQAQQQKVVELEMQKLAAEAKKDDSQGEKNLMAAHNPPELQEKNLRETNARLFAENQRMKKLLEGK